MKKLFFAFVIMLTTAMSAKAMSYEQAREQALFLTDKMAYELNLSESQYEAAYEINLDYLMSVNTVDDVYGTYWTHRNLDLSYIFLDWQYRAFCAAEYFYRPLYWNAGYWHFRIFGHYPHRDFFYYGRPAFYLTYHGGHSWHMNGGHSWYHGRTFHHTHAVGMRDGYNRGGYRNMSHGWRPNDGGNRGIQNSNMGQRRNGTMNHGQMNGTRNGGVNGSHNSGVNNSHNNATEHRPMRQGTTTGNNERPSSTRSTVGNATPSNHAYTPSRSFGSQKRSSMQPSSVGGTSVATPSRSSSSFPSHSTSSSPSTRSNSSAGSSHSVGGGSFSGGSRSNGGSHFGGRR